METIRMVAQQSVRPSHVYHRARLKQELLDFLARHPNTSFTAGIISCALDHRKLEVEIVLRELVMTKMVIVDYINTDIGESCTLYKLTGDRPVNS